MVPPVFCILHVLLNFTFKHHGPLLSTAYDRWMNISNYSCLFCIIDYLFLWQLMV